ncbi:MAG: hypothetical protein ACE141_15630 [Bryobacteraceae bacterium]
MASGRPRLTILEQQILDHWKEHRPKMYAGLKRSGRLVESVRAEAERTAELKSQLESDPRIPPGGAAELLWECGAFYRDEEDQPELGGPVEEQ